MRKWLCVRECVYVCVCVRARVCACSGFVPPCGHKHKQIANFELISRNQRQHLSYYFTHDCIPAFAHSSWKYTLAYTL